jgi:hypothetical protein
MNAAECGDDPIAFYRSEKEEVGGPREVVRWSMSSPSNFGEWGGEVTERRFVKR